MCTYNLALCSEALYFEENIWNIIIIKFTSLNYKFKKKKKKKKKKIHIKGYNGTPSVYVVEVR